MLIEYRIKFENGGWTISQRIEPNGNGAAAERLLPPTKSKREGNELPDHFVPPGTPRPGEVALVPRAAPTDGEPENPGPGGGPPSQAMTIVFGPVVLAMPNGPGKGGGEPEDPGPGGGEPEDPGPGGVADPTEH